MAAQGLNLKADFSQLARLVGTVKGYSSAVESDIYINDLLKVAHQIAAKEFNAAVASVAIAASGTPKSLSHMYEWGTIGINKGRTTRAMQPTNPDAMLWTHVMKGRGRAKTIDFKFRPSTVPVPQPTTAKTKVARKYLDRLNGKQYKFHWKAPVMEFGTTVHLKPNKAKMIFVPFYGKPKTRNAYDIKRGFLFHKGPLNSVPGKTVKGNFSSFWIGWWASAGAKSMKDNTKTAVALHAGKVIHTKAGTMRGVRSGKSGMKTWSYDVSVAAGIAKAKTLALNKGGNTPSELDYNLAKGVWHG